MGLQHPVPGGDHHLRRQLPSLQPWAADVCQSAIARGCDHPHAVRILARAWVRVIYRCWVDNKPYDPAVHGGAARLADSLREREAA